MRGNSIDNSIDTQKRVFCLSTPSLLPDKGNNNYIKASKLDEKVPNKVPIQSPKRKRRILLQKKAPST